MNIGELGKLYVCKYVNSSSLVSLVAGTPRTRRATPATGFMYLPKAPAGYTLPAGANESLPDAGLLSKPLRALASGTIAHQPYIAGFPGAGLKLVKPPAFLSWVSA